MFYFNAIGSSETLIDGKKIFMTESNGGRDFTDFVDKDNTNRLIQEIALEFEITFFDYNSIQEVHNWPISIKVLDDQGEGTINFIFS